MLATLWSGCVQGLRAFMVRVEVDLQSGLPSFCVVGLPDISVKESKERVRSAFKNNDFSFPMKRVTVNLAPAHIRKEGSSFELAIALGLLMCEEKWNCQPFTKYVFLGELSLQGDLSPIRGMLSLVLAAQKNGFQKFFVPKDNAQEAAMVSGVEIFAIQNLKEAVQVLKNEIILTPVIFDPTTARSKPTSDFSEVRGQPWAKKAIEVAAAGGHNLLMVGPPGCGKTMLAKRIPTLLPELSYQESLETTQVYSVAGLIKKEEPFISRRPFRSPHHTISYSALVGGGRTSLMPGEVSLAHHGVLFLDEFPEFRKDVLEVLREPMEEGKISICRVAQRSTFPARFMLVAAMNPCPCGYLGHSKKECRCSDIQISRYRSKVSGPLFDRIDIQVSVSAVSLDELPQTKEEDSKTIFERVVKARTLQQERLKEFKFLTNSAMNPVAIQKFCVLKPEAEKILNQAMNQFGLSYRTYHRLLKVSRTLADLEGESLIQTPHIAQALQMRFLDR